MLMVCPHLDPAEDLTFAESRKETIAAEMSCTTSARS
jgi:urease alpha subunit